MKGVRAASGCSKGLKGQSHRGANGRETLAVRQKRKATRRGRDDDGENACFTGATKDFTSRLLFSRSLVARARQRRTARRLTMRTQGGSPAAVLRFFPPCFPKRHASQRRQNAPFFHRSATTIRGTMCQFVIPPPFNLLIYIHISKMDPHHAASVISLAI